MSYGELWIPPGTLRLSLSDLVAASAREHERSYAHSSNDLEAWAVFRLEAAYDLADAPAVAKALAFALGCWRSQGFPRVVLGPRRAASLMATGVASEQMLDVLPPWRAFLVELHNSPVVVRDPHAADGEAAIDRVLMHYSLHHEARPSWTMIASTTMGTSLQRMCVFPEDWLTDTLTSEGPVDAFSVDVDDRDLRALTALSRLVAGLAMSLSDDEFRAAARKRAAGKSYRRRRRGPPVLTDFVLGDDVRVDAREAVGQYIERGGRSPTVQSLVRGHWKRQPYGPRREKRKWIHVEPYWRGPEDAPVLIRRHKIGERGGNE